MIENIKVDIIYYRTSSDFELEFNLCGCCRMRLLNDKAADKKALIHDLARAVSRSKVIIITGALFEEDGIIDVVSNAIGKGVTEINNSEYGIKTDDKIRVISGATPLVTEDKIFGGMIIESGPQTMILISDNKSIRKPIMNNLIHPYVSELYAISLQDENSSFKHEPSQTEDVIEDTENEENKDVVIDDNSNELTEEQNDIKTEEINQETEIKEDTKEEVTEDKTNDEALNQAEKPNENQNLNQPEQAEETDKKQVPLNDFIIDDIKSNTKEDTNYNDVLLSDGMIFETDDKTKTNKLYPEDEDSFLIVDSKKKKKRKSEYYNEEYQSSADENSSGLYIENNNKAHLNRTLALNIPILVITIILLLVIAILCYSLFYAPTKDGTTASMYLKHIFETLFSK